MSTSHEDAVRRAALVLYERLNPPSSPVAIYSALWYHETAEEILKAVFPLKSVPDA